MGKQITHLQKNTYIYLSQGIEKESSELPQELFLNLERYEKGFTHRVSVRDGCSWLYRISLFSFQVLQRFVSSSQFLGSSALTHRLAQSMFSHRSFFQQSSGWLADFIYSSVNINARSKLP